MDVLIDFDDSFTYNLKQYLCIIGLQPVVVNWREFCSIDLSEVKSMTLGPGPGHPKDYLSFSFWLKKAILKRHLKVFGVCLGHQIICNLYDFKLGYMERPIHGQSKKVKLDSFFKQIFDVSFLNCQFYNSLYVSALGVSSRQKNLYFQEFDNMVILFQTENIFSMQFHPESIGSSSTFKGVKKFFL